MSNYSREWARRRVVPLAIVYGIAAVAYIALIVSLPFLIRP